MSPVDPSMRFLVEQAGPEALAQRPAIEPMDLIAAMRASTSPEAVKAALKASGSSQAPLPMRSVEDRTAPGPAGAIPVRVYTPEGSGPFPLLNFFHGGGWVAGSLESHDRLCKYLCYEAGCLVISVDYRLAPEHRFPAGLDDCYAVTCWTAEHAAELGGDPRRSAVAGDSGGGTLAAGVAQMVRDQGGPALALQLLYCPVMDFRLTTASWRDYDGYLISSEDFMTMLDIYLESAEERARLYAAPGLTEDLRGLPAAVIMTAEYDPTRDGAEDYGRRLQEVGIPATVTRYAGMVHNFEHYMESVPQARQAVFEAGQVLRAAFAAVG